MDENKKRYVQCTVPLKSKLPVASRFRRDANRVARYAIRVARESSKRKMSGIIRLNSLRDFAQRSTIVALATFNLQ